MRFVWFWTFWHWSTESFRGGSLLRAPLQGIGGHWDEWFRHEASQNERQAIEEIGRNQSTQRQFIVWLLRHWAGEANLRGNRLASRFVLVQLAQLPPFSQWAAFKKYRAGCGVGGISAIVLGEESPGEPADVRLVEAVVLPADATAPRVVSEGFQADAAELNTARRAAMSLLSGKGLLVFLGLWIAGGCRPYPRWLRLVLGLGWLAAGGLIVYLLAGPDPDSRLFLFSAVLVALWGGLVLTAITVVVGQSVNAWHQGRNWRANLEQSQVRLRMNGGLTLKGGSAGLPFCLNTLLALDRSFPRLVGRSWLWERFFRKLRSEARYWAATGVVTTDARVRPVVLEPKLRACLQHPGIGNILTPRQRDAGRQFLDRPAQAPTLANRENASGTPFTTGARLGFAAEQHRLRRHCCRHAAQSMMALGSFTSGWQMTVNALAVVVSAAMLLALPDLRNILLPPPAPAVVGPVSPSPYHLWVSLATKKPEYFQVVLESDYWSNRRATVKPYSGANASVRAEIFLHRLAGQTTRAEEDGTVWVERRRRFLHREYAPGERVGRYSVSYLTRLDHE